VVVDLGHGSYNWHFSKENKFGSSLLSRVAS
jgi:hypothetical protein